MEENATERQVREANERTMKWAEDETASHVEWLKKNEMVRDMARDSGDKVKDITLERILYYDHQTNMDTPEIQFAFYSGMIQAYLNVQKHLTTKTTNHVVIVPAKKEDGVKLREDIQNKYSLYDNCVDEGEGKRIVIEGANRKQLNSLVGRIALDFSARVGSLHYECELPMTESIIDDGRDGETGGLEV